MSGSRKQSEPGQLVHTALDPEEPPLPGIGEATLDGQIVSGKLAGRTLADGIRILALPVLLQQVLAAGVGLVDKMIAGHLPAEVVVPAMDGIGIGAYLAWFIGIALTGVGVGAQAIIARAIGAGRVHEAQVTAGRAIVVALAWGAVVGVGIAALVEPLAHFCGLTEAASLYCAQFVRTLALAMPFLSVMTVGTMCLHGAGETTLPSWIAGLVNVANVVGAVAFSGVTVHLGPLAVGPLLPIDPAVHGVQGIALGAAASYAVGAVLTVAVLARGVKDLKVGRADLRPTWETVWRIARIGIPNFAEGIALWAVNLFVLAFLGRIAAGSAGGLVGAHMIAVQWEAFSFLPGFAVGTAAATLAGQYLGAGNPALARKAISTCTAIGVAIMVPLGILLVVLRHPLVAVISTDPVHLREAPPLLLLCGTIQAFFALGIVIRGGLRGVGDTKWVLLITVISSYGVRLPLAWLIGVTMGLGLTGIWVALCIELVVRGLLFLWRYRNGGWLRVTV